MESYQDVKRDGNYTFFLLSQYFMSNVGMRQKMFAASSTAGFQLLEWFAIVA